MATPLPPELRANSNEGAPSALATDLQGVDLTLIRYTLGLTPTERLQALEDFMNTLATVRVVRRATTGAAER